jgi:hypothetical protein
MAKRLIWSAAIHPGRAPSPDTQLLIDGAWGAAAAGGLLLDPATGEQIGSLARAERDDLDQSRRTRPRRDTPRGRGGFGLWLGRGSEAIDAYLVAKFVPHA